LRLGNLFALFLIVGGAYLSVKVLPSFMANYEFQNAVEQEARLSIYTGADIDDIRSHVMDKAKTLSLPISDDDVEIERSASSVHIVVNYDVPIQVPVKPFSLHFSANYQESHY